MTISGESAPGIFGRKVLRNIYCSLRAANGVSRRRWNDELHEIYEDIHIVQRFQETAVALAGLCGWIRIFKFCKFSMQDPLVEVPSQTGYLQLAPNSEKKK